MKNYIELLTWCPAEDSTFRALWLKKSLL